MNNRLVKQLALSLSLMLSLPLTSMAETTAKAGNLTAVAEPATSAVLGNPTPATNQQALQSQTGAACLSWIDPDVNPWAAMLCVHGLGLANDAYTDFGKRMASLGIATYSIDVRGFGSWKEAKGHQEVDFKDCLNDVKGALIAIHKANPELPVFLVGESMGGAIALQATALYPDLVQGLISSVPAGDRFKQKRTDLKVAMHILEPNKQFDIGKSVVNQATDNAKVKNEWEDDPLDRMDLSAKELIQFQNFMNQNHDRAKGITHTPVLILQGGKDHLVKPEGTIELFNELTTQDKDLILVGGAEHLILEENQFNDEIIDIITAFADKHAEKVDNQIASAEPEVTTVQSATASIATTPDATTSGAASAPTVSQAIAQSQKTKQGAKAHLKLAEAYIRNHDHLRARQHLTKALKEGNGSAVSAEANKQLLMLPQAMVAPKMGAETQAIAGKYDTLLQSLPNVDGTAKTNNGATKPTVLCFSATWCEPCQKLDTALAKQIAAYGNKINFVTVNIDDPKNAALVEEYGVSPVPTLLFLDKNSQVVSYLIGFSDESTLNQAINKLL